MTNVLNAIIANKPIRPTVQDKSPSFTFDSEGRIKPLKDKGKLLPSKIFGSPVEYAKDLKQDVLNIGKAAKGKANDHELGRINDLAMKFGSLCLATYLFIKNPLKLSKAMEFVGFGSFFASMALWPKLAIQAPLKVRTGVDIHQKYIDSQGRKKMLHQDPQYDLTDLYSREDLDKMGKKLNVSENLPDRDDFIKQRAKKTAIQGNTLWMATAGFATPLMSALICNRLEKPIAKAIEKYDLISSSVGMEKGAANGPISKLKQHLAQISLNKFLQQNADRVMDDKLVSELAVKLGGKANSATLQDAIKEELKSLKTNVKLDESFIRAAVGDKVPQDIFNTLSEKQRTLLNKSIAEGSVRGISDIIASAVPGTKHEQMQLKKTIASLIEKAKTSQELPKLSVISDKVQSMYSSLSSFASEKAMLDKFITARVGDKSGTYIANQWGRVGDKLIKSLKLNTAELKALSQGNMDVLMDKLSQLAANEMEYDKTINDLMRLIGDYESKTGTPVVSRIKQKAQDICSRASGDLQTKGFSKVADKITSSSQKGTLETVINVNTAERISGAQSSFYRLIQAIDIIKKSKDGKLNQQLSRILKEEGQKFDIATLEKLSKACQKVVLTATTTDYVEKLKSAGFELSEVEYKAVMKALFDNKIDTANTLEQSLSKSVGTERAQEILQGFRNYKDEFMNKVANWQNGMTKDLSRRTVTGITNSANAVERNNIAGKPIKNLIQDVAKQTYNSQKWLKIFGTTFAALTVITLALGLTFGRKSKMEKQIEEESKVK